MVVEDIFVRFRTNFAEFKNGIKQAGDVFSPFQSKIKNLGANVGMLNNKFKKTVSGIKNMKASAREFKMELLSVMFGMQMVSQSLLGLLNPAMQAAGVFDLWGALLITYFMPAALKVQQWLMDFWAWLDKMEEKYPGFQEFVNNFVLIGGIVTGALGSLAAFGLLWDGLVVTFTKVVPQLTKIVTSLVTLSGLGKFIGIALVIKGIKELTDGAILKGLGSIFGGVGLTLAKSKLGTGLIAAGLILSITDLIKGGEWSITDRLSNALLGGVLGFKLGGPWGAGLGVLLTIVISEIFSKDSVADKFVNWIKDKVVQPIKDAYAIATGKTPSVGYYMNAAGVKQSGGYIPHTGLYKLHAGETVNQSSSSFSPTINVNASSNVDIEMLKTQLSSQWNDDFSRLSRG